MHKQTAINYPFCWRAKCTLIHIGRLQSMFSYQGATSILVRGYEVTGVYWAPAQIVHLVRVHHARTDSGLTVSLSLIVVTL